MTHCWADRGEHDEAWKWSVYYVDDAVPGMTCMLSAGHDGPHEWTSDSDIGLTFGPACAPKD